MSSASEDPVQDKNKAMAFAAKAKEKTAIDTDAKNPNRAILTVGNDDFPVPIPIVKTEGQMGFRHEERAAGNLKPPDWNQRAGRDCDLPRVRGSAAQVRGGKT